MSAPQHTSPDVSAAVDPTAAPAPKRRSTATDLAQVAVFAALIAALGLPVPSTSAAPPCRSRSRRSA